MNLQKPQSRHTLWLVLTGILLTVVFPVAAQNGVVTDDDVNAVAKEIYCPVCESTPLDVCATAACADWRELIREKLTAGETKEDIFNYFSHQYGDGVLANPPREGFNLILWVAPVAAIGLGFLLFGRFMRNLRGTGERKPIPSPLLAPVPKSSGNKYIDQVEAELREL